MPLLLDCCSGKESPWELGKNYRLRRINVSTDKHGLNVINDLILIMHFLFSFYIQLKARASERALIEERRECANLRQKWVQFQKIFKKCIYKIALCLISWAASASQDRGVQWQNVRFRACAVQARTSRAPHASSTERWAPSLFLYHYYYFNSFSLLHFWLLNCFHTAEAGDSYGPSPVSGGAPSPPIMMEDPGRPPSGRRSETFGESLSWSDCFNANSKFQWMFYCDAKHIWALF